MFYKHYEEICSEEICSEEMCSEESVRSIYSANIPSHLLLINIR